MITMQFGRDPWDILKGVGIDGISAYEAGAWSETRESDYALFVPDAYVEAVTAVVASGATPDAIPVVPQAVSETQFMRAAVKVGMVTASEAEAYLARGELPAFVSAALAMMPEGVQIDARLKAIGAANFSRADSVFAALIAGGAVTTEQVDQLFILADAQE